MFSLNFKKDWRMNKSAFISFFVIIIILFAVNAGFYSVIKLTDFNKTTLSILSGVWSILATLSSLAGTVLTIVLMYFVLKGDLGKNKVQYSIFTPQSLLSWYLPKVLFVFIVQSLFALIDMGYSYFIFDLFPEQAVTAFEFWDSITAFLTAGLNFGFFAMLTLSVAVYYSFRSKGKAWAIIIGVVFIYLLGAIGYTIYQQIQVAVNKAVFKYIPTLVISYGIKNTIGLIYIFIAMHLFNKKIEY